MKSKSRDEICERIKVKRCKLSELLDEKVQLEEELKQLKSRYNDFNGINVLPFEVLSLVLERVPLQSLLVCERVCRKWRAVVQQLKIEEAVIGKLGEAPKKWCHNDAPVLASSIIVRSQLKFAQFENSFLASIKRLKIANSSDDPLTSRTPHVPLLNDLDEFVNRLTRLETLEIAKIHFDQPATLSLPNLRYLAVKELGSELELNCPNLSEVKTSQSSAYPVYVFKEKITHLHLATIYRNNEMFANLRYICWKASSHFCHRCDLPANQSLQVLSVRPRVSTNYYKYSKENFLNFLAQKNDSARHQLKLVFFGVLLESAAQLEGLNDGGDQFRDLTKLQLRNYGQLYDDELRWIKKINYSSVMRAIADGVIDAVPKDLHQRFDRVREVYVDSKVEDETHLFEFLKKFGRLEKVSVSKAALGAAFYERLAVELPLIRALFLHEADSHFPALNFVLKFPNLIELKAKGLKIDRDFVQALFETYPIFTLTFAKHSRYREDYETFRRAHPKMRLEYLSHEPRDFYDVKQLIQFYFNEPTNEGEREESEESDESESD